jgi:hypothetical protein
MKGNVKVEITIANPNIVINDIIGATKILIGKLIRGILPFL